MRVPATMLAALALSSVAVESALATPACTVAGDRAAAAGAARWLTARPAGAMAPGQQADSITALRAAGRPVADLRGRLAVLLPSAPRYAVTAASAAKVVLAAVAADADPRRLGGVDYLARIDRSFADGRFGATAFDQALAMIALRSAGRAVPAGAVSALRATRGDGGWGFALRPSGPDSVDATALVLEAMAAARVPVRDRAVAGALAWVAAQRAPDGGFASAGGRRPAEANATAGVVRARCALGQGRDARAMHALRALRQGEGSVRFTRRNEGSTLLATLDALPALAGRPLGAP